MPTGPDRILVQNRIDFVTGAARRYLPDAGALTEIAAGVRALVAGRDAEALRREPAAGEWSALRTLGHMIAYARTLHDQLDRMAHMTDPELPLNDDAAAAGRERWESRGGDELAGLFAEAAGRTAELLKRLPDSSWGRAGLHPLWGRRSIVQHVRAAADHLRSHVRQIEAALGEPGGGA